MAYDITTLLNDVSGVMHGTTVNKVPNIYGTINRAARAVLLDVDPKETQRIVQLSQVFNSVYDYAAPTDLKGDRLIDIRPQAGRQADDVFFQGYETAFDANKGWSWENKVYIQNNTGVKTLRIQAPSLSAPLTLTDTSTVTNWSTNNGASTITLDTTNNVAGGGALVFNIAAANSWGGVQNASLSPLDLSSYASIATGFVWVYIPDATHITGVQVQWGTDASNYWFSTQTSTQQGTSFQNGWNLIAVPWASASVLGSPISSQVKFANVMFSTDGTTITGVKVCNFTFTLGYYFEAVYYSSCLFRDPATNVFQETVVDITDNNKLINLGTDSYNLLFNKTAYFVAQSLQGSDAQYDAILFGGTDGQGGEYGNALKRYRSLNPSEAMSKGEQYYSTARKNYRRY